MKRFIIAVLAMAGAFAFQAPAAQARVRIHVDLSTQRMTVESSTGSYVWPVSTARSGYSTPRGAYAPTSLQRMHYSRKYHMSPMPYSIFFRGGYAIHGTYSTAQLGRPASHGCVRLAPGHAAALFEMVRNEAASISISGSPPGGRMFARAHSHRTHYAAAHWRHHRYAAAAHHHTPMAYAPVYRGPGMGAWQRNPARY